MEASPLHLALADVIRRQSAELTQRWLQVLRAHPACRPVQLLEELAVRSDTLLTALVECLESGPVDLTSEAYRSVVREFSFVGGWLASQEASPTLVALYTPALGEAIHSVLEPGPSYFQEWRSLEQGLQTLMMETYCLSLKAAERQRQRETLEASTPVLRLPGDVPALILVGQPDREIVSGLCGRLLLEVARWGSDALVVDLTYSVELPPDSLSVLAGLAGHRKLTQRDVVMVAATPAQQQAVTDLLLHTDHITFLDEWAEVLGWLDRRS